MKLDHTYKKPVAVICNDNLETLRNRRAYIVGNWGNEVEVIVASSYMNFVGQMNRLVASDNFPDFVSFDASFRDDIRAMILHLAQLYGQQTTDGRKPWPQYMSIDSAGPDYAEEMIDELQSLPAELPKDIANFFNLYQGDSLNVEAAVRSALLKLYPGLKEKTQDEQSDLFLEAFQNNDIENFGNKSSLNGQAIRSLLEYYYKDQRLSARLAKAAKNQIGKIPDGGFGVPISGYIAYTIEDIERIEDKRRGSSTVYSQETILVVREFNEREHAPLLPRIRGLVICGGTFEPHIQIMLQNFGISTLIGMDYDTLKKSLPAVMNYGDPEDYGYEELVKITLDPESLSLTPDYSERLEHLPFTTSQLMQGIRKHFNEQSLLSVQIKIQADHYTQSGSLFADSANGIGLIRSESLMRGHADHYDAAVSAMVSVSEDDAAIDQWQNKQESALREIIESMRYEQPVCFRLADFGTGDFLPPEQIKKIQEQLGGQVLLPQGVQLAYLKPQIYKAQLRAAFTVAHDLRVSALEILIPQVQSAADVDFVKSLAADVAAEQGQKTITNYKIGSMIETNEAVDDLGQIAAKSDFLSVGMNDLTRLNQPVSRLWHERQAFSKAQGFDPYKKPPQHLLDKVAAAILKIPPHDIRLCGEFASTVDGILFAQKAGIDHVVVTPTQDCIDTHSLIASEILWRESSGALNPIKADDPPQKLYSELGLKRLDY